IRIATSLPGTSSPATRWASKIFWTRFIPIFHPFKNILVKSSNLVNAKRGRRNGDHCLWDYTGCLACGASIHPLGSPLLEPTVQPRLCESEHFTCYQRAVEMNLDSGAIERYKTI